MDWKERENRIWNNGSRLYHLIIGPLAVMPLFELFTHRPLEEEGVMALVLNLFLFLLIELFLFFITGSLKAAQRIMCFVFVVFGLAEYYMIKFRGIPLLPMDIFSIQTAAEVARDYDYSLGYMQVLALCGFGVFLLATVFCTLKFNKDWKYHIEIRITGILLSLALMVVYCAAMGNASILTILGMYSNEASPLTMTMKNGTATAFLTELSDSFLKEPEGYDKDIAVGLLEPYEEEDAAKGEDAGGLEQADIIVIMNEAFSDLAVLSPFTTTPDYMPFMHSLMEGAGNTVTGELNVSVVGGNTPNTEFEFLTGHSLAFLPQGSVPFQTYVQHDLEALPVYLDSRGYETMSLHPYLSGGWERDQVYPHLGFQKMLFLEDMPKDSEIIREYVSDRASFRKIISEYEERDTSKPFFLFNVTMQNHSPYDGVFDNFEVDVQSNEFNSWETLSYLSLIRRSDDAFRELTEYFAGVDRPVVVMMFGDHQPGLSTVEPIWGLGGRDGMHLSDQENARKYIVPFAIWANFPIEEEHGVETSVNFLGNRMLKAAGVPLAPYRRFLDDVAARFPVVSNIRVVDEEGESEFSSALSRELWDYQMLQYYMLFDRESEP